VIGVGSEKVCAVPSLFLSLPYLTTRKAKQYQKLVKEYLIDVVSARMGEGSPATQKPPLSVTMHVQFIAGAVLSLLAWWLEHDMPLSPYQMAQYLLSSHGTLSSHT
jgi:tetracycline repressor-like protein